MARSTLLKLHALKDTEISQDEKGKKVNTCNTVFSWNPGQHSTIGSLSLTLSWDKVKPTLYKHHSFFSWKISGSWEELSESNSAVQWSSTTRHALLLLDSVLHFHANFITEDEWSILNYSSFKILLSEQTYVRLNKEGSTLICYILQTK